MHYRLRTMTLLLVLVCVPIYGCALYAPSSIAIAVYCVMAWLMPAYWIAGVIYGRDFRRAFFIGGLAGGAVPFLMMVAYTVMLASSGWGSWGHGGYVRDGFGESMLQNLVVSLFIFAPVLLSVLGGFLSLAVYFALQPRSRVPPPTSPFQPPAKQVV